MFEQRLRPLPLRIDSDFLSQNKGLVASYPHAVKSELQGVTPQLLSPEYRHYEVLKQRFYALCHWIEINLGFQVSPEQKLALLQKVYIVSPEKFRQYAQSKNSENMNSAIAFMNGLTREVVIRDLDETQLASLIWNFNHEAVHDLSLTRIGAKLKTRGHRRNYSENITRLGLTRLVNNKRFFLTMNEAATEMLNVESLGGFFQHNTAFEGDQYGLLMIFNEVLIRSLAAKTGGKETSQSFRHKLYADMLSGSTDFFTAVRNCYGGNYVRKLALLNMYKPQKMYDSMQEYVLSLGADASNSFSNLLDDFICFKPVTVMESMRIQRAPKDLD